MKAKEESLWAKANGEYMSDISEDEEGSLMKHNLLWRSAG